MRRDSYRPLLSVYKRAFCSVALVGGLLLNTATFAQQQGQPKAPRFAPGVLTTIEPEVTPADLLQVHDIMEIRANADLKRKPHFETESRTLFEMAKDVNFRHHVWALELSFKQLRMLHVDIPQPSGKMQRKLIWYQVYRVRNTGAGLAPQQKEDSTFTTVNKPADQVRFVPQFVLTSQDRDQAGQRVRKSYLDRVIPAAVQAIQRRELPGGELLNSVQISEQVLKVEEGRATNGLWGVATWEDVDPQIDFFSVFVGGLNNAYRWQDSPENYQLGDPPGKGRKIRRKLLQLNFWRPGDTLAENEREIRYGVAPGFADDYGVGEGVAYQWVYR